MDVGQEGFEHTATYDMAICAYFERKVEDAPRLPEVQLKHDVLVSTSDMGKICTKKRHYIVVWRKECPSRCFRVKR